MNTYYLKKFRRAAKKHVKVELLKMDADDMRLVIGTNDATGPLYQPKTEIGKRVYGWWFRLRYPYGRLVREKEYYATINECNRLEEHPHPAHIIELEYMRRDQQIKCLNEARRLYILKRAQEAKSMRDHIDDIKWKKELQMEKLKAYQELKQL